MRIYLVFTQDTSIQVSHRIDVTVRFGLNFTTVCGFLFVLPLVLPKTEREKNPRRFGDVAAGCLVIE